MRPLIAIFLLALAACGEAPQPAPGQSGAPTPAKASTGVDRSRAGTPAPDLQFQDPQGEPTSLAEFRGRPLLVNLWATWCAPCIEEMPTLDALAGRESGLQVLAVSQDLEGRDKVDAFFAKHGFEALEPYLDPEMQLMTQLGAAQLPTTILYDAEGLEVWRYSGKEDWSGERAAALIREGS